MDPPNRIKSDKIYESTGQIITGWCGNLIVAFPIIQQVK